jgi:hypothetical protein
MITPTEREEADAFGNRYGSRAYFVVGRNVSWRMFKKHLGAAWLALRAWWACQWRCWTG